MHWTTGALAVTLAVMVALGGEGLLHLSGSAGTAVSAPSNTIVSDAVAVPAGATSVPLPSEARIVLTVSLASPHAGALSSFLSNVENPVSPEYRHFLTFRQYVAEFAPSAASVSTVEGVLAAAGAESIVAFPDRSAVSASFTPPEIRSLFGVEMVRFGDESQLPLYTAVGSVHLPSSLAGEVTAVDGLSNAADPSFTWNLAKVSPRPMAVSGAPGDFIYDNRSEAQWFVGSDYTQLFGATRLFPGPASTPNATFPTKVAIATLLASGYNATLGTELPPWDPSVLDLYYNSTLPPSWPAPTVLGVPVTIDGLVPPAPGSFGGVNDSTSDEDENSLDLEMAASLAPGATVANFYFAGGLLDGAAISYSSLAEDFAVSLGDALGYDYGSARLAVVSCSFGLPDLTDIAWDNETAAAAAMGVTIVVASGDQADAPNDKTGRQSGPWPTWPATADTNTTGAVAVGGVSLSVGGLPTLVYNDSGPLGLAYDSNMTGIKSLTAWYDNPPGYQIAGTEGGDSTIYPEPYWQFHSAAQWAIINATEAQGSGAVGRAEPDVALPGNSTLATVFANSTGAVFLYPLEGTSVAAPVFAGLLADVVAVESNQSASGWAPLGFFAPEIYRIASYYAAYPSAADPFTAVTVGRNYAFSASPGWDALTGWGIVNASLLLAADETPAVRDYSYTGPTPTLPHSSPGPGVPWTEIYVVFGAGILAAILIVVVVGRSRRRPAGGSNVPYGAQVGGGPPFGPGVQGGIYPGATFLCPFCGAVRPAEPVRCPQCGAY